MSAKSPVIVDLKFIPEEVEAALAGAFPDREVIDLADPDLKVVFSGGACGAGVDHPLTLPGLPTLAPPLQVARGIFLKTKTPH